MQSQAKKKINPIENSEMQARSLQGHRVFLRGYCHMGLALSDAYFDCVQKVFIDPRFVVFQFKNFSGKNHTLALSFTPIIENIDFKIASSFDIWLQLCPSCLSRPLVVLLNEVINRTKSLNPKPLTDSLGSRLKSIRLEDKKELKLEDFLKAAHTEFVFHSGIHKAFLGFVQKCRTRLKKFDRLQVGIHPFFLIFSVKGVPSKTIKGEYYPLMDEPLTGLVELNPYTFISDYTNPDLVEYSFVLQLINLGNNFNPINIKNSQFMILPISKAIR